METIQIKISRLNSDGTCKTIYQNSVVHTSSVEFPFAQVLQVLKLIYPNSSAVEFTIVN